MSTVEAICCIAKSVGRGVKQATAFTLERRTQPVPCNHGMSASEMVVVIDQASDLDPRVSHAEVLRLIEKVVEHPPIKAVAETVLHRLARRELMSFQTHLPHHASTLLLVSSA